MIRDDEGYLGLQDGSRAGGILEEKGQLLKEGLADHEEARDTELHVLLGARCDLGTGLGDHTLNVDQGFAVDALGELDHLDRHGVVLLKHGLDRGGPLPQDDEGQLVAYTSQASQLRIRTVGRELQVVMEEEVTHQCRAQCRDVP